MKFVIGLFCSTLCLVSFNSQVEAKAVTFTDISQGLESKIREANEVNICYTSNIVSSDNDIIITYKKTYNKECITMYISDKIVSSWQFRLSYENNKLVFISYLTGDIKELYKSSPYGVSSLIKMDDYWMNETLEILGFPKDMVGYSLKGKYEALKNVYSYDVPDCGSGNQACAVVVESMDYYVSFVYLFSDVIEITEIKEDSIKIKFNNFMNSTVFCPQFSRSLDNVNYTNLGQSEECYNEYIDTDLKPNTTYYYKFQDVVVKAQTLKADNLTDNSNQNLKNDGSNNFTDNTTNNNNDISNPATGNSSIFIMLLVLIVGFFIIIKKIKKYKLFLWK